MFATTRVTRRSPNPKVFPPTPPLETAPISVEQIPTQHIDELSLGVPAGQNAPDSRNAAAKQQSILCPYFLKNPHLLPESSICRLRDFENVEVLKNHIEQDHQLPLRPRLNGDTELERFHDIWTQMFQSNDGDVPHPYLCNREFLRKQQNLRVIEMLEAYVNGQLRDQPAVAAVIQNLFLLFRERFSPKNFGHFFLPEPIPSIPDSGNASPESRKVDLGDLGDENDLGIQSQALPVSSRKKSSFDAESNDSCSATSNYDRPKRGLPDFPSSFLLPIKERMMNQAIEELRSIADEGLWEFVERCSDADTEDITSLSVSDGEMDNEPTDAGGQSSRQSTSSGRSDISQSTNNSATQGSNNGKRPASGSGPNGGNGGRGGKRRRPAPTKYNGFEPSSRRLSCPYFKKDPGRLRSNHSCSKPPGFENANRVKEHVYRAHRTLPECPRCFEELETIEQLSNHIREGLCDTLDKKDRPEREAITNEQVEKLKSKKDLKGLSEEDKWRKMYRIIFSLCEDAETPSPYFEPSRWYMDKFRAYCGKRLPNLVRMKLEHQLETSLLDMLITTIQQCQEELFTSFIEAEKSGSLDNDEIEDSDVAQALDWSDIQLPSDPLWFSTDYGQPFSGFDPAADFF